jgi:hypothetical protein
MSHDIGSLGLVGPCGSSSDIFAMPIKLSHTYKHRIRRSDNEVSAKQKLLDKVKERLWVCSHQYFTTHLCLFSMTVNSSIYTKRIRKKQRKFIVIIFYAALLCWFAHSILAIFITYCVGPFPSSPVGSLPHLPLQY